MKKLKNVCLIVFSGIYNKDISQKHLDKAEEFYESAKYASHNEFSSVFIDNLFSACELAIKAILLTNPTTKLREKASHKVIQIRMNENVELGNIEEKYRKIFDDLSILRRTERYLENGLKKIVVNKEEMLNTTKTLIDFAKSHIRIC